MAVNIIDPSKDPRWDDFVSCHPWGSVYQLSSYKEVINNTVQNAIPYYIVYEEGKDIKAGIPFFLMNGFLSGKKLISLPYAQFCDPLVDSKDHFNVLFEKAVEVLKDCKGRAIEFRMIRNEKMMTDMRISRKENAFKYHVLRTSSDRESLFKLFHKKCIQKRIEKANKNNVEVFQGKTREDLKDFYHVLVRNRKYLGLPPQPFSFFDNYMRFLDRKEIFQLLLARWDGKIIAGSLLLRFKDRVIIDYLAHDRKYVNISPAVKLLWEIIDAASRNGYTYVDFGKSHIDNVGLIDFKRKWGCEEYDLPYCCYGNSHGAIKVNEETFTYQIAKKFFRFSPLSLGKVAGYLFYKYKRQ